MVKHLLEAAAMFVIIMTYLLTDNPYIVAALFGTIIVIHGVQAGGNPFVVTIKALLGRSETETFKSLFRAQIVGVISAILFYQLLIKLKVIQKHKLDRI